MSAYEKLRALLISLAEVVPSIAASVPFVRADNQISWSGPLAVFPDVSANDAGTM